MLLKYPISMATLMLIAGVTMCAENQKGAIEFGLAYYDNPDGSGGTDGNPFLDEALTVVEPVLLFDYALSDVHTLHGKFSYDYVSGASIDRLSNFRAQSGASGDYYIGADVGVTKQVSDTRTRDLHGHISTEYDYISFGFGTTLGNELPARNASYSLDFDGFYDVVDVIRYNGEEEGSDTRITLSSSLRWYQIMTPVLQAEIGGSATYQSGFLETPFNAVVIEDTAEPNPNLVGNAPGREVTEELDDTRIRLAAFGRLRRWMTARQAAEIGGRLYADTWGITGLALEPHWYVWLQPDTLRLRLRYRFYTQTAADDYAERFTTEPAQRTQDSDLADFNAHSVGGMLTWYHDGERRIELGSDYVLRSDDLNQVLGRLAYRWTF